MSDQHITDEMQRAAHEAFGEAVRAAVAAALAAAPAVDGWVWCDAHGEPRVSPCIIGRWVNDHPREGFRTFVEDDCLGPHRTLLLGPATGDDR